MWAEKKPCGGTGFDYDYERESMARFTLGEGSSDTGEVPRPAANGAVQQAIAFCDVLWPNNFLAVAEQSRSLEAAAGSVSGRRGGDQRLKPADGVLGCMTPSESAWPGGRRFAIRSFSRRGCLNRVSGPWGRRMRNAWVVAETNHHLRHYGSHLRLRTAHYQPCCGPAEHLLFLSQDTSVAARPSVHPLGWCESSTE